MVAAGGIVGAVMRYIVSGFIQKIHGTHFPYGTFFVNIIGAFLIGFLGTFMVERMNVDPHWRIFITAGVLGSFTTFSSIEYESLRLFETGMLDLALFNLLGSVGIGFFAVWLGALLARSI